MKEFRERLYSDHAQILEIQELLYQGQTGLQEAVVFRNPTFGTVLALDGVVQLTDRDNHIYHETMAHVPIVAHGAARDVLIVGGGDGGVLKEVLKHPVRKVVLAEIDRSVIELSRRYFPSVSDGAFDDGRTSLMIGDAASYLAHTDEEFDVVIVDSTDPIGPGEALFSSEFYRNCRAVLRRSGLMVAQSGVPFYWSDRLEQSRYRLQQWFGAARALLAPVPTYANGLLALLAAASTAGALCPPSEVLEQRMAAIRGGCRYYAPDTHIAAFAMAARLGSMKSGTEPSVERSRHPVDGNAEAFGSGRARRLPV